LRIAELAAEVFDDVGLAGADHDAQLVRAARKHPV